jgi:hypothetical protein
MALARWRQTQSRTGVVEMTDQMTEQEWMELGRRAVASIG